jgi:hypothetical protein
MVNAGDSYNQVQVFRSEAGYVFIGAGAFAAGISSSTEDSFTITFATSDESGVVQVTTIPLASAQDVDRMTIESRDSSNVASASESFVRVQDTSDAGTLTSSEDVAGSTSVVNDGTGYVNVLVKNGDGENLSTSGALVATATNGAVIAWNTAPTSSSAVRFDVSGVLYVKQGSANANDLTSTTITISFNGINLATKTITFAGGDSDPGPDEPETRNIIWDDACPYGSCSVSSFGGQQTYVYLGDSPTITDFPSDPEAYGWTFSGWAGNFASNGDLTMTATWTEDNNGGGYCSVVDPWGNCLD